MNDFWELVIPASTVSFIFLVVFGFFGFLRYLRYKETLALAERGLLRPMRGRGNGRSSLKWGIMTACLGGGVACSLITAGAVSGEAGLAALGIILGVVPASFGFGLIVVDRVNRRDGERAPLANAEEEIDLIPPHKQ